ncbi:MAG TPA: DNA recombination protein RmuC [Candidatus Magasanikbacteria bacterium]|nr:DNA recombination protein RmuC [Candidatus Magasanikbacteria bacterium]
MEQTLIILFLILILITLGLLLAVFLKLKSWQQKSPKDDQSIFLMLQNQLNELSRTVDTKLSETHKSVQQQYGISTKIIQDVTEKLTKLEETNKNVIGFAEQLQSLEDILKNPKQRGILGEYYLETVLKNVLPPKSYQMQYKLGKTEEGRDLIVDAVVFVKEKIVPIDSKFSLENYNRLIEERDPQEKERLEKLFKQDLKNRIDETAKYVLPDKGTTDFAFMFIPAEAIYYDLLVNQVGAVKVNTKDLIEYATKEKHVIIVSPTSFLAYLQTVLQGLRALQMEESIKDVVKKVGDLNKHLLAYDDYFKKLGNNLSTTVNSYNTAYKELNKIDKDITHITGSEKGIEVLQIDKPTLDN